MGAWYDAADTRTLFQDVNGATPVTENGQLLNLMRDKSGNKNDASTNTMLSSVIYNSTGSVSRSLAIDSGLVGSDFGNPTAILIALDVDIISKAAEASVIAGLQDDVDKRYNLLVAVGLEQQTQVFITFSDGTRIIEDLGVLSGRHLITIVFDNGNVTVRVDGRSVLEQSGTPGALGGESNTISILNDFSTKDRAALSKIYQLIVSENISDKNINLIESKIRSIPLSLFNSKKIADAPHWVQGMEIDNKQNIAWIASTNEGKELAKYDATTWTELSSVSMSSITPSITPKSLGDICYHDNALYIGCGNYVEGGSAYIIKVNPDTLEYITHYDISTTCKSGVNAIFWHNDSFYVGESAKSASNFNPALYRFTSTLDFVEKVWQSDTTYNLHFQSGCVVGGCHAVFALHNSDLAVFDISGSNIDFIKTVPLEYTQDTQGVVYVENQLYITNRPSDAKSEILVCDVNFLIR